MALRHPEHCVPVKALYHQAMWFSPACSQTPSGRREGPWKAYAAFTPQMGYSGFLESGHKAHLLLNSDIFFHALPSLALQRHGAHT